MADAGERKVVEMRNGKRKIKSTGDKYQEGDTDWQGVHGRRGVGEAKEQNAVN